MNNRQNGRRRGRGGQQARNGQPGNGSRVDNRARGNAPQMYEKYKAMARDAQMQGDRVNTEYYLQFADHYFRVLSENRSRFEEQRRPRDEYQQDFGSEDDDDVQRGDQARDGDDGWDDGEDQRGDASYEPQRNPQAAHPQHGGQRSAGRNPYPQANMASAPNGHAQNGGDRAGPPPAAPLVESSSGRLDADRMPPPLTLDVAGAAEARSGEDAPAPKRRRARKPRVDAAPTETSAPA